LKTYKQASGHGRAVRFRRIVFKPAGTL